MSEANNIESSINKNPEEGVFKDLIKKLDHSHTNEEIVSLLARLVEVAVSDQELLTAKKYVETYSPNPESLVRRIDTKRAELDS